MQPGPPIDADARRVQQLKIAAAVVGGLIVITVIALALSGKGKHSPTKVEAGATTTTSEGTTTTTSALGATTTTVQPAQTTAPPPTTTPAAASTTVVTSPAACKPIGDLHAILFVRHAPAPRWDIWKYDPATCHSSQVTRGGGNPNVLNFGPSWSPAHDKIAFVRKDAGLMVMNPDGSGEHLLFAENNNQTSGAWTAWSPDGKRIAFAGRTDGIWLVDSSSGTTKKLVSDAEAQSPTWSPDGTHIAFSVRQQIVIVRTDGSERKVVGPAGTSPDWGPDGRIAFSPDGTGVAVMNADGSGVKQLVVDSTAAEPDWSPDGRQLAYGSNSEGILAVNADGTGKRQLVPGGSDQPNSTSW